MEKYILWGIVFVSIFIALFSTRKDKDENNSLTKKGFIKLMLIFAGVFLFTVIYVIVTG